MGQRSLGEEHRRGAIVVVFSVWIGLPIGEIFVVELILGEKLPIWGVVLLGKVCTLL